jgi:glycosyltransferase involved in cell wall biosynthesis
MEPLSLVILTFNEAETNGAVIPEIPPASHFDIIVADGGSTDGAVAQADTNISVLIQQSLRAVGRTDDTEVTAFTDGCPGLRSILVDAGITAPPFLDWFHIAMRIQHAAQTAGGLPTDNPGRMKAKSVIVDEVERLPLAHLERQGEECQAQHRPSPQGHACLQGRTRPTHEERAFAQAVARTA